MSIRWVGPQDILESSLQTLAVTVNVIGIMGKGVALAFRRHFPGLYDDYRSKYPPLSQATYNPELVYHLSTFQLPDGRQVLYFPTKGKWWLGSDIRWIESNLHALALNYQRWGITSLALPMLGCGNGGLAWSDVAPLIEQYLGELPIEIEVYGPKL